MRKSPHRVRIASGWQLSACIPAHRDTQRTNCNVAWCKTPVGWRTKSWRTLSEAEMKNISHYTGNILLYG